MLFFVLLAGACAALGVWAGKRLLTQRFPHPADVATISLIYYVAPLAVAGYFYLNYGGLVFLNKYAAVQSLALQSMIYLTLALSALLAGRLASSALGPARSLAFISIRRQTEVRLQIAFVFLIGLIGLGILLFGVVEFFSGYASRSFLGTSEIGNAIVYWSIESLGLVIMIGVLQLRQSFNPRIAISIVITLMVLAAVFVVRAKRLEIVAALLPSVLVLLSSRASFQLSTKRVVIGVAAVAVLVLISSIRVDSGLNPFLSIFYLFAEGLYAGHTLPGVIERVSNGTLPMEYGARYLSGLIAFVPGFIWEGKDDMVYAGNLQLQALAPLGATNILAEVVLQGEYIAVAVSFFLMGFVFDRLTGFIPTWDSALADGYFPFRFGLYAIAIAFVIPHFRDGIIPSVKIGFQMTVFYVILVGLRLLIKSRASATSAAGLQLPTSSAAGRG